MTCLFIGWAFEGSLPAGAANHNAQQSAAAVNAIKRFIAIDYGRLTRAIPGERRDFSGSEYHSAVRNSRRGTLTMTLRLFAALVAACGLVTLQAARADAPQAPTADTAPAVQAELAYT